MSSKEGIGVKCRIKRPTRFSFYFIVAIAPFRQRLHPILRPGASYSDQRNGSVISVQSKYFLATVTFFLLPTYPLPQAIKGWRAASC